MKKIKYIILLISIIFIVVGLIINKQNINIDNIIDGYYLEESGMLFLIKDKELYWYKDYTNLNNNYYKGKTEIHNLNYYNLTKSEIKSKYGNINKNNFYIIKFYPEYLKENKYIKLNNNYNITFNLLLNTNEGILYNYMNEKQYIITKIKK